MITYVTGSLFQSPAKALVNTVNTVGVMGKGIAYEFKRIYPEMFTQYQKLCQTNQIQIGSLWLYKSSNKWVVNFPTKKHWKQPSQVSYIEAGLEAFVANYTEMGIESIAFPPLGCGNGELAFETQVQPLMETYLASLPIDVFIYPQRIDSFTLPEHLDVREVKKWLRSEPKSLPFVEVWEDLQQLLGQTNKFTTITKESAFQAFCNLDPKGIRLETGSKTRIITEESLSDFWIQLRDHGLSYRNIAPSGTEREVSYLTSIFCKLPYVKPVQVSENAKGLENRPSTGLQVLPQAFVTSQRYKQVSLFEGD